MFCETKSRFKGAEEAMRFYFRLRDLLHRGCATRLVAAELPADACPSAVNAIDDYRSIGCCLRGLDEVALWLLSELYGPTCFGVHRRTFSHARRAGRQEFPRREFRLRELALIHEHALGVVKRNLRELAMIPGHQMKPMRECRRIISVSKRAHLQVDRAAEPG